MGGIKKSEGLLRVRQRKRGKGVPDMGEQSKREGEPSRNVRFQKLQSNLICLTVVNAQNASKYLMCSS